MKYLLSIFILIISNVVSWSQATTLDACIDAAKAQNPITKKIEYINLNKKYLSINANRAYFPQLNVNGHATYQSDVTGIPQIVPGVIIPSLSKDQYQIQGELIQTLYDGGFRTSQIKMIESQALLQMQQVEVNLATLQQQVTDVYFGILMLDGQLKQQNILMSNLDNAIKIAEAALAQGVSFKSSVNELKAEKLNAEMSLADVQFSRKNMIEALEMLTDKDFDEGTVFVEPNTPYTFSNEIKRPELRLFQLQKDNIAIQSKQAASNLLPTLSAFVMGGYGRPTLNMLNDDFGGYWVAGVKLKWSINTLMSLPNTRKSLAMSDKMLDADKETFKLNTQIAMKKESTAFEKYNQLLKKDDEIIALREAVMLAAQAQLENGVITTTDYITKLSAENMAKSIKDIHRLQLLKSQYNYLIISGNYNN